MREIKFRVFDKIKKQMHPVTKIAFTGLNQEARRIHFNEIHRNIENCELMQYTGLKDRHGIEICEGDIISCPAIVENFPLLVKFEFPAFMLYGKHFSFNDKSSTSIKDNLLYPFPSSNWKIEVIGNIHENPELMENKNENS